MLTKEQIRDRLKIYHVELDGTTRKALFPEEADPDKKAVPERKTRYVVGIWINGDGTSRQVDIEKTTEAEPVGHTMLFENVPVPPADQCPVPEFWHFDIENPFLNLEGGTNLTAVADVADAKPQVTIIYWDSVEI